MGIDKKRVEKLQYRGNGWPSGIQITLDDGRVIKRDNWTYPWTLMHSSLLFRPKRCLYCKFKTVRDSDINLADPWIKEYEGIDKIGNSVVVVNTEKGNSILEELQTNDKAILHEINEKVYVESQKGTIELKKKKAEQSRFNKLIFRLSQSKSYMFLMTITPNFMKLHNKLILYLLKILES